MVLHVFFNQRPTIKNMLSCADYCSDKIPSVLGLKSHDPNEGELTKEKSGV